MKINGINAGINFGYSHKLKTLFLKGDMPSVTRGLYGNPINPENVSLEHLRPHSKGGKSTLSNFALADKNANSARGSRPLAEFLDKGMTESYLAQFNFEIPGEFNGFQYQEMIRKTCNDLGVGESIGTPQKLPVRAVSKKVSPKVPLEVKEIPLGIDYGNMKEVIANINLINPALLSKKMLKSLKKRGFFNKLGWNFFYNLSTFFFKNSYINWVIVGTASIILSSIHRTSLLEE